MIIVLHALRPKRPLVKLLIGRIEHAGICADTVHEEAVTITVMAVKTVSSA